MPDSPSTLPAAPADDVMIRLEKVTKTYPGAHEPAVHELSLSINRGEFIIFVGPSGCGKTTTLRMINRLVEPTSGRILIDGKDVTHVDPDQMRRRIGYVIQQIGLMPHMTVAENVALVPQLLGTGKKERLARAEELLALVGLDPKVHARRYPKQLSGGQQQRVGVARALAADPPVMLMDEPFGAVDPIARVKLQEEFLRVQEQVRKTIVMVTHDIDEALMLGDRIAIFKPGSVLAQFATPLEVLTNPADDFVRDFIGSDASVRRLDLVHVGDVLATGARPADGQPVRTPVRVGERATVHEALEQVLDAGADGVLVDGGSFAGATISLQDLLVASRQVGARPGAAAATGHGAAGSTVAGGPR